MVWAPPSPSEPSLDSPVTDSEKGVQPQGVCLGKKGNSCRGPGRETEKRNRVSQNECGQLMEVGRGGRNLTTLETL